MLFHLFLLGIVFLTIWKHFLLLSADNLQKQSVDKIATWLATARVLAKVENLFFFVGGLFIPPNRSFHTFGFRACVDAFYRKLYFQIVQPRLDKQFHWQKHGTITNAMLCYISFDRSLKSRQLVIWIVKTHYYKLRNNILEHHCTFRSNLNIFFKNKISNKWHFILRTLCLLLKAFCKSSLSR